MACEHDENTSVNEELQRLPNLRRRDPAPRPAGTLIILSVDSSETHEQLKLGALADALERVLARTGTRFDGLTVYLGAACRCIAYSGEESGNRSQILFLGDQMLEKTALGSPENISGVRGGFGNMGERGVADQQYDTQRKHVLNPSRLLSPQTYQDAKISAKAVAVIVHELGHLLHETRSPNAFWSLKTAKNVEGGESDRPPANVAMQVSQYATKNKLEYVAEVFTGLVYGRGYSNEVMEQYESYGGVSLG